MLKKKSVPISQMSETAKRALAATGRQVDNRICISIECAKSAVIALRYVGGMYKNGKLNDDWAKQIQRELDKLEKKHGR